MNKLDTLISDMIYSAKRLGLNIKELKAVIEPSENTKDGSANIVRINITNNVKDFSKTIGYK
jgi:hypothetical protein